jgi:hypothetical protein
MSSNVDEKVGHAAVVLSDEPPPAQFHRAAMAPASPPGRRAMAAQEGLDDHLHRTRAARAAQALNERTKVPMAEYIREGIDLVLQKHRDKLPGQLPLDAVGPRPPHAPFLAASSAPHRPTRRADPPRKSARRSPDRHVDRTHAHPQLLHHRAHRPRQEHAGRSHPRVHRRPVGARAVEQFLDKMDIERERGITIKAQHVRLATRPTTADSTRSTSSTPRATSTSPTRSRARSQACEGALLVVDATQGVEAQTLANVYLAVEANLEIIPVLNKIDLPSADPERTRQEIEDVVGIDCLRGRARQRQDRHRHEGDPRGGGRQGEAAHGRPRRPPSAPSSSTAGTTATAAPSWWCASWRARSARATRSTSWPPARVRGHRDRRLHPAPGGPRRARAGRGGLPRRQHPLGARHQDRRHHHPRQAPRDRGPPGLQGREAHGVRGHLPHGQRGLHQPPRRPREAPAQRRERSASSPTPPRPWASGSAAASSGCSTWRSSRSGWSASTTSTSSSPPPAWSTGCAARRRDGRRREPRAAARPGEASSHRRALPQAHAPHPANASGPSCSSARTAAASRSGCSTSAPSG